MSGELPVDPSTLLAGFGELEAAKTDFGLEVRTGSIARVSHETLKTAQEVWSALRALGGEGWVCCTDSVLLWRNEIRPEDAGTPLSAEIVAGDTSLHVRQQGRGWLATRLQKSDEDGGWLVAWNVLGRGPAGGKLLRYETCWTVQQGVLRPRRFRFAGFRDTRGKEGG